MTSGLMGACEDGGAYDESWSWSVRFCSGSPTCSALLCRRRAQIRKFLFSALNVTMLCGLYLPFCVHVCLFFVCVWFDRSVCLPLSHSQRGLRLWRLDPEMDSRMRRWRSFCLLIRLHQNPTWQCAMWLSLLFWVYQLSNTGVSK